MEKYGITRRGASLIEAVVAVGIITLAVLGTIGVFQQITKVASENTEEIKSKMLLAEGVEAMRLLRDESWSTNITPLSEDTRYWLRYSTTTGRWSATTSPQIIQGRFNRYFNISSVKRDNTTDDIVQSGGYTDDGTKRIDMTVRWATTSATSTESATFILSNLYDN